MLLDCMESLFDIWHRRKDDKYERKRVVFIEYTINIMVSC